MSTKGKQEKSWFAKYGNRKYQGLIGQIFFPTDGDKLDVNDRAVLDALANEYFTIVLGRRVTLTVIGHADHRGSDEYNEALALRRARAVEAHMKKAFRSASYMHIVTDTRGERFAIRDFLAGDRRVDIWASFVQKRPPIGVPEIKITGRVPVKLVSRPVQILDIARVRMFSGEAHDYEPNYMHAIIFEKYEMVPEDAKLPHSPRTTDGPLWILPSVKVERMTLKWRKPTGSDTGLAVEKFALEILLEALGTAPQPSDAIPPLKGPSIIYKSWREYKKRNPKSEVVKYENRRFTMRKK